jgi:hypothetical protein
MLGRPCFPVFSRQPPDEAEQDMSPDPESQAPLQDEAPKDEATQEDRSAA